MIADIQQVISPDIFQGVKDTSFYFGIIILELFKQIPDPDSFLITGGKAAGRKVNRQPFLGTIGNDFFFIKISQGTDNRDGTGK